VSFVVLFFFFFLLVRQEGTFLSRLSGLFSHFDWFILGTLQGLPSNRLLSSPRGGVTTLFFPGGCRRFPVGIVFSFAMGPFDLY